jgi:hypothetical protein
MHSTLYLLVIAIALNIALTNADLVRDILSALQNATDCASCHMRVLPPLQELARQGNDPFVNGLIQICEITKVCLQSNYKTPYSSNFAQSEDTDVCVGELNRSGPILAHALRQFSTHGITATKFCEAAFGLCQVKSPFLYTIQSLFSRYSNLRLRRSMSHFLDLHQQSNAQSPLTAVPHLKLFIFQMFISTEIIRCGSLRKIQNSKANIAMP